MSGRCMALLMLCGWCMLHARPAAAATSRLGLFVAHHDGGSDLPKLRYAQRDAERLMDALHHDGSFATDQTELLVDPSASDMREALQAFGERVRVAQKTGDVLAVFYYSGHAHRGDLLLGDEHFPMDELKAQLAQWPATVRLAFVDSCGAGALTRSKGASLGPPLLVEVDAQLQNRGQVVIASSAADEASQESDEVQGSYFTHHLATGLRGRADLDHDGRVSLNEAYRYAYDHTVAATTDSRGGTQHPSFAYDLQGTGDVVLTTPGAADVILEFPAQVAGRFFVVDMKRQLFVAEFDKSAGDTSTISLPAGQYAIKKRLASHLLLQQLPTIAKGHVVVDEARMDRVAFADDYAKGSPMLGENRGVRFAVGVGGFGHLPFDTGADRGGELLFAMPMASAQLRWSGLFGTGMSVTVDATGGSRPATRSLDNGQQFAIQHSLLHVGTTGAWSIPVGPLHAHVGARLGAVFVHAAFDKDAPVDAQTYLAFVPGVAGGLLWAPVDFLYVELQLRGSYLPYNVDDRRHIVLADAGIILWWNP
jgi:hypothetical protein